MLKPFCRADDGRYTLTTSRVAVVVFIIIVNIVIIIHHYYAHGAPNYIAHRYR